jgi:hypothetical protein
MISRRTIPSMPYGALGASICMAAACCVATACSSPTLPGFPTTDGGEPSSTGNTDQNTASNTTEGQVTSTGSTYTGPSSTGSSTTGTGTGPATTTSSGTGASTATNTSTTGAAYCNNNNHPTYSTTCSAPTTGGIALENCVPVAITDNSSGYVVATGDGMSTACVDTNAICGSGMTMSQGTPPNYNIYGSGISVGLGSGVAATGSGLTYAVSSVPMYGLELSVTTAAGEYYAEVPAGSTGSGTIMWSTFNTTGYLPVPDGGMFSPTGATITSVGFQVNAGAEAVSWTLCVTALTL